MSNKTNPITTYKPTNIPWLGDIPADWELVPLKHYFDFEKGYDAQIFTGEYCGNNQGEYPVYSGQTENQGIMGKINRFVYESDQRLFVTTVGAKFMTIRIVEGKYSLSQNCALIVDKNPKICVKFYYYELQAQFDYEKPLIPDIIQPSLRFEDLVKYKIPLPPLQTQKAIASHLDTKCELIAKYIADKTKIIELLKEQKKSLIYNTATKGLDQNTKLKPSGVEWLGDIPSDWEVRRLKDICNINPTKGIIVVSDKDVVFLPMEKVNANGEIEQDLIKPTNQLSTGFTYFEKNDVIFAKITPCFENGKGAFLDKLNSEYGFGSTEFHVLRANLQLTIPRYIDYIRRSDSFMNIGETFMQGSAGQKRITTDFIKDFPAPLPPLQIQTAIVTHLDTQTAIIDDTISKIQREIELIQEYKKSLIYNAVTGKITV